MYEDFLVLIAKKQITLHDLKTSTYRELLCYQTIADIASFIEYKQEEDFKKEQEKKHQS